MKLAKRLIAGASAEKDTQFRNVTALLSGDGTNGAQNNTFVDSSSNNFAITRNGNTTQGSFSPYGDSWSVFFSGGNERFTYPASSNWDLSSGTFTIECWVLLLSAPSTYTRLIMVGPNGSTSGFCFSIGTNLTFDCGIPYGPSTAIATAANAVPVGSWAHLAVSVSAGSASLYVNGVRQAGPTAITVPTSSSANPLYIGYDTVGTVDGKITGYVSNMRFNKSAALYSGASFTVPQSPLTAVSGTTLLTFQSNRFIDNSTANNGVTVTSTPRVTSMGPFNPKRDYQPSLDGGSVYVDGNGDNLLIPANTAFDLGTGDFTIDGWLYYEDTPNSYPSIIATQGGWSSGSFAIRLDNLGSNRFGIFWNPVGDPWITSSDTYAPGQWLHFALTRASNSFTLWVNGTSQATGTSSTAINLGFGGNVSVGQSPWDGGQGYTKGFISDLRVVKGTALYSSAFTPPTSPVSAVSGTSLLLRGTGGAIVDASRDSVVETVGNAQISTSVRRIGTGAMYFDGTGDYLLLSDPSAGRFGTGDFTVEYWANFGAQGTNYAPQVGTLSGSPAGTWRFGTFSNINALYFAYHDGANYQDVIFGSGNYRDNTWRHFAISRQNGVLRAFVDGVQVGTNQTVTQSFYSSNRVVVGAELASPTYFTGYIDDLRITRSARYTANFTPPTRALPTQ